MTTDFRLKDTIKGYLMSLRELTGEDSRKIATRLGYENNPFLKLDTDEKYNGSTQLLAGIKTLLELEKINRKKFSIVSSRSLRRAKMPSLLHLSLLLASFCMFVAPETVAINDRQRGGLHGGWEAAREMVKPTSLWVDDEPLGAAPAMSGSTT